MGRRAAGYGAPSLGFAIAGVACIVTDPWVHLRYFRTIAEVGSLTAAARKLGVAQPTLSSAVKKLEDHLGSTLLLRNARGVTVTPTGAALAAAAWEVFSVLDDAEQRIRGLERDDVGDFAIGCHESLGAYFLPTFMRNFLERAAGIEIRVWNGTSVEVREAVLRREVHFGLVVEPTPHDELVMVDAFPDAVAVVGRRDVVGAGGVEHAHAAASPPTATPASSWCSIPRCRRSPIASCSAGAPTPTAPARGCGRSRRWWITGGRSRRFRARSSPRRGSGGSRVAGGLRAGEAVGRLRFAAARFRE